MHEVHFAGVTQNFPDYFNSKSMPAWEVPGMLVKYHVTAKAVEIALKSNHE